MGPLSKAELWLLRGNALSVGLLWLIANVDGLEALVDPRAYATALVWVLCAGPCVVVAITLLRIVTWLVVQRDEHGNG